MTIAPAARAAGRVRVPGDKSISHRYALLGAIADGESVISGYSPGADCAATLECLRGLGVTIRRTAAATVVISGRGLGGLRPAPSPVDAVNSGTTMRLLSGIAAAHPFRTVLTGDASLQRRPMRRIIEPLTRMGARITAENGRPPLTIDGGGLHGIAHEPEVPSAQVKSGVLLAGLHATGRTRVIERVATRDHTEHALEAFGATVVRDGTSIEIEGGQRLHARTLTVPGDISGAAFWAALAGGTAHSDIHIDGVGLNLSRIAVLEVFRRAGVQVHWSKDAENAGEPVGTLRFTFGEPESFTIDASEAPLVIDEIPALARPGGDDAARADVHGSWRGRVAGQGERSHLGACGRISRDGLRRRRIRRRLHARGAAAERRRGRCRRRSPAGHGLCDCRDPAHRRPTTIAGASSVDVSYPGFFDELARLTR